MLVFWCSLLLFGADLASAQKAMAAGRPQRALEILETLSADAQDTVPALLLETRALRALGRSGEAVDPVLRALEKAGEDAVVLEEAARTCIASALESSASLTARALLLDGRRFAARAQAYDLVGQAEEYLNNAAAAAEAYRAAIGAGKGTRAVHEGHGRALRALGRDAEARAAFRTALEKALAASNLDAAWRTAFLGSAGGRLLQWLDARLKARPGDLRLKRFRGFARSRLFLHDGAVADLEEVLRRNPADTPVGNELVRSLLALCEQGRNIERMDQAETHGLGLLKRLPRNADLRAQLLWAARIHWAEGRQERARRLLAALYEADPTDAVVGLNLGAVSRRIGRLKEAQAVYEALLEEYPEDAAVLNDLGILLDGTGDRAGAVACWRRALAEDSESLDALENLFTAAWERGDLARAKALAARGLQTAKSAGGPVDRWRWFRDRLSWIPEAGKQAG